jgi:predicted acetyltransferase
MSDLENFKAMLDRCDAGYNEYTGAAEWDEDSMLNSWTSELDPKTATIIVVMPGYRCHYEAAFDTEGNMLETGQFGEM